MVPEGEWIRYSSPQGTEYIAICLPAFSPELVHRDDESAAINREDGGENEPMVFEEPGREGFTLIEELWNQLIDHHAHNVQFFSEELLSRSFTERRDQILKTNKNRHLLIQVARLEKIRKIIGFCISSAADRDYGEIESIYVDTAFRSLGIGTTFINRACSWMKENRVSEMVVGVCEGNEESFEFYQRLGFFLRRYYLKRKEL